MGRTRNAHKKRLLERQKTTESAFYRRGHEGLRPLKRVVCSGVFDAALFENVKACIDAW